LLQQATGLWFDTFSTAVAEDAAGLMHVFAVDRTASLRLPPPARQHPFRSTTDTVLVAEARRHAAPVSDKHPKLTNGDIPVVVGGVWIHAFATDWIKRGQVAPIYLNTKNH